MAQPLVVPLPPNIALWGSCVLRVAAIDPTDGSIVTGVTVTSVTIECIDVHGNLPDIPNPIMIASTA